MNIKKSALSLALASVLSTGTSQANVIDMNFNGLFTMLDPGGKALPNTSYPYYGDTSWGYGLRTQISGTMAFDLNTGAGTGTIQPFEFFSKGPAAASGIEFQSIGGDLILGNMNFSWNGSNTTTQIVLNAAGLFAAIDAGFPPVNSILDQAACTGLPCATPASNDINNGKYPIGPTPIATSSFNVADATGLGTTLSQLSLGTDDGIGGSPMDNGPFSGFNINLDITQIATLSFGPPVPLPTSIWLFGSGLLGLAGVAARRRKI